MKKLMVLLMALMSTMVLHAQSTVYMTKEISPAALVRIYKALGGSCTWSCSHKDQFWRNGWQQLSQAYIDPGSCG